MSLLRLLPAATAPRPLRERELDCWRLVLDATRARSLGRAGWEFLLARAGREVAALEPGDLRRALERAIGGAAGRELDRAEVSGALVVCGGLLERHGQHAPAVESYRLAAHVRPDEPALLLHVARAHRKAGDRAAALELYRRVRELGGARLARFSGLGEALLSDDTSTALGAVIDEAEIAGDREVAAVALEERALLRRSARRFREAADDLARAGLQFDGRRDRLRVAHALADLLTATGDPDGAREALTAALELSRGAERDVAIQRIRSLARAAGDQLALRRYPAVGATGMVSLMPARRVRSSGDSLAPAVRLWTEAVVAGAS